MQIACQHSANIMMSPCFICIVCLFDLVLRSPLTSDHLEWEVTNNLNVWRMNDKPIDLNSNFDFNDIEFGKTYPCLRLWSWFCWSWRNVVANKKLIFLRSFLVLVFLLLAVSDNENSSQPFYLQIKSKKSWHSKKNRLLFQSYVKKDQKLVSDLQKGL